MTIDCHMLISNFLYNTYLYCLLTYYIDVSKPKKKLYLGHQLLVGNFKNKYSMAPTLALRQIKRHITEESVYANNHTGSKINIFIMRTSRTDISKTIRT